MPCQDDPRRPQVHGFGGKRVKSSFTASSKYAEQHDNVEVNRELVRGAQLIESVHGADFADVRNSKCDLCHRFGRPKNYVKRVIET